jgi:hypothetical protein
MDIFLNRKWDVIVKIDRKGILIFDDITRGISLEVKCVANYKFFLSDKNLYENKKILLFDDSIHEGKTIVKAIDSILIHNPSSLDIAAVLAEKNVFKQLKMKFCEPNINFMEPYMFGDGEKHFSSLYKKYISPYLDYICLPQTKDLITDKIICPTYMNDETIINLFSNKEASIRVYQSYDDRKKMEMKIKCNIKELIEIEKKPFDLIFDYDQLRIRFFVHRVNFQTIIYIEYIAFPDDFQKPTKPCKSCALKTKKWKENGEECLACIIYNTTKKLRKIILKEIKEENIKKLKWIFNEEIIDAEYEF